MSPLAFSLKPFRTKVGPPRVAIAGSIGRKANVLSVAYEIHGDLSEIAIPERVEFPARQDRLWEDTCLELFVGADGSAAYWEFNLSPAGHWNVYRFDSYRGGMREEPVFSSLPFDVRTGPGTFRLALDVGIGMLVPGGKAADAAVCAVVRTKAGESTHWALSHPGPRPDFHRRDGFRLRL